MAKSISQLCQEADELFTVKVAEAQRRGSPDDYSQPSEKVASLLGQLNQFGMAKEAGFEERLIESLAMVDTVLNLPTLAKMAALEKKASESGIPEAQIESFFEKNASKFEMKSIVDLIPWLQKG
jgi:hypothetical protein